MKKLFMTLHRKLLIGSLCSMGLAGCVYYGDIHSHSHEIDTKTLVTPHRYTPQQISPVARAGWWTLFHDPELNALIAVAMQDSPDLQSAKARVEAATHLAERAESALWPTVDLSGYLQRQRFPEEGLIPPPFNGKIFNIGELGLNFNYEFDFWGKNRQALRAKINEEYAAKAELAESELVLSAAIAEVYFRLEYDLSVIRLAKEKVAVNEALLRIVSNRMHHGIESDIPVKRTLATLAQTKETLEQYRQGEALSRHQLAVLLGENPFTTDIRTKQFAFHHYPVSIPSSLPAHLLANRPDILAAKWQVEAAANQVNVAKAWFFPDINLSALYSYQSIELNQLFTAQNRNNALTGAIDLPIFDAGARRAGLREKYAEYDLAVFQYNRTLLAALRDVADQLSSLRAINAELNAENLSYHALSHTYDLYRTRYRHGIADYAEVLENRDSLLQQSMAQLALQRAQVQTVVLLLKALGGRDV
ncbi:MAG TPA: efflux transporter outer membrane subunit [Gammaproteobacteria bacterium]|nr:efflux transporter outer membrane subunit [Gammaproteobacteria bacterium]